MDSSLLAALLGEIEAENDEPTSDQIQDLRAILGELAAQADESQLFDDSSDVRLASATDETSSTPDFYRGDTATTSSGDDSSGSSQYPFNSPLGFLQAALPHVSTAKLMSALVDGSNDDGEIDMENVVSAILTNEFVRELEERGLESFNEDELDVMDNDELAWKTVESKRSSRDIVKAGKRKTQRGKKIAISDVRQQHHARPASSRNSSELPDPWTQLSSMSTHLATLLPPHDSNFFQSYFHSPTYNTPYQALCSALESICSSQDSSDEHTQVLFGLLDILLPRYDSLAVDERSRLISDTQLAVIATNGRGDDAMALTELLRDLDSDSSSGQLEMGVYHLPPPSPSPASPAAEAWHKSRLPTGPPSIQPPPVLRAKFKPPTPPPSRKPNPFQWQDVPQRQKANGSPHPLAHRIPAYAKDVNGIKTGIKGSGNGIGKGGKGDVGELSHYRRKIDASLKKRNQLLREASKMWQRGNSKTRGGEVAYYFAEKVKHFFHSHRSHRI